MRARQRSWSCASSAGSAWRRPPTCCTSPTTRSSGTGGWPSSGCCASWNANEMSDASARWQRVEELCHAALERDASDRAAFLAAACGDDAALRREGGRLRGHAQTAEGFLGAPVGAVAAQVMSDGAPEPWVGRRIGAYEIVSPLGAGGMGEVYRARDTQLGREVAIKVLPPA